MRIHVHRGKGAKYRYVPLPEATLHILRSYWKLHRNPVWRFPRLGRNGKEGPCATIPMAKASIQGASRRVLKQRLLAIVINLIAGCPTISSIPGNHLLSPHLINPFIRASTSTGFFNRATAHAHQLKDSARIFLLVLCWLYCIIWSDLRSGGVYPRQKPGAWL